MTITSGARKRLIYSVLATALSSLAMGAVAIEYANHAIAQNQRQWCEVVSTLDEAYKENPPTTPTGRHLAEEFRRLRDSFECEKG